MPDALSKMDEGLSEIYDNYHYLLEIGWENPDWLHPILQTEGVHKVPISIMFIGNLAKLVETGLEIIGVPTNGCVDAMVDLNLLESISLNSQILEMIYGIRPTINLDTSTIDINARQNEDPNHPFVWGVDKTTGAFTTNTGEGVIIGFIDDGIDFTHPVFLKNAQETRILSIWDQGLKKQTGDKSPKDTPQGGTQSYGVEYTQEMINKVLQKDPGAPDIRHKNIGGHGTHVASIAAGDGRAVQFFERTGYVYVGVAPKASIIMVKHMDLEFPPPGVNINTQFKDAVNYILEIANSRPVVINVSLGTEMGPHDGRDEISDFLESTFNQTVGKACVTTTGNSAGEKTHAIVTIPSTGWIDVPVNAWDIHTIGTNNNSGLPAPITASMFVQIWYSNIPSKQVTFAVKHPEINTFTNHLPISLTRIGGDKDPMVLTHTSVKANVRAGGTAFTRNKFVLTSNPIGGRHRTGTYLIKIVGPPNTVLHIWCRHTPEAGFKIIDGNPQIPGLKVTDDNTISSWACSRNVISVASYDDSNGEIARTSSQGMPVQYFGDKTILPDKPDIAAPGENIRAARSRSHAFPTNMIQQMLGYNYTEKSGTSMAAPHVAGLVALIFKKNLLSGLTK